MAMKCKNCGAENPDAKRCCTECGAFLEGYTTNNVTGEYGYRGADGNFYKSQELYERARKIQEEVQTAMQDKIEPLIQQMTSLFGVAFQAGFDVGLKCSKYLDKEELQ